MSGIMDRVKWIDNIDFKKWIENIERGMLAYDYMKSLMDVGRPLGISDSEIYYRDLDKKLDRDEYYRQVHESDGYYVDPSKSFNTLVGITPRRFNNKDKDDVCVKFAKLAIDTFNHRRLSFPPEDSHGELKFVTLLNANGHTDLGTMYYLTFEAMNLANGNTYTYQATVHDSMPLLPNVVMAFRLKPAPGSTKTWFWNDPCCGGEEKSAGEGVSKDSDVVKVTAMFVVDAEFGYKIFDACLGRHIYSFTGAHYGLEETKSDRRKKVIVLEGTPEQVQEAIPMAVECIRKFQDYQVTGNETMHCNKDGLAKL